MPSLPDQNPNTSPDLDRLPAEFDPGLHRVDALLRTHARSTRFPEGLTDRLFNASSPLLARRASVGRIGPHPAIRIARRSWRSRLAMAASVAIVGGVAAWFLSHPTSPAPAGRDLVLTADLDLFTTGPLDEVERDVAYLLDTGALSSFDELTGELAANFSDLGM